VLLVFLVSAGSNLALSAARPSAGFPLALLAILLGENLLVTWIAAATLRRQAGSPRPAWRPDGALLLFAVLQVALAVAAWLLGLMIHTTWALPAVALQTAFGLLLMVPVLPWLVAVAVERPLAASPKRFLRAADLWLLPLLLLAAVILLPLEIVQGLATTALFSLHAGIVTLGLLAAAVTAANFVASLALALAAYRAVAKS
jgi:hypothetical protein